MFELCIGKFCNYSRPILGKYWWVYDFVAYTLQGTPRSNTRGVKS